MTPSGSGGSGAGTGGKTPIDDGCGEPGAKPLPAGPRELAIGKGTGAVFAAYQDGDSIALVLGAQGGYMVMPVLRISASPSDSAHTCVAISVDNSIPDAGVPISSFATTMAFTGDGPGLYSPALRDLLTFDGQTLPGKKLTLEVKAAQSGFQAERRVTLVLK
jgi:hypothetical protein